MDKQNITIYKTKDDKTTVALYAIDGNVWLTQNQLPELFATSRPNITMHIANILKESELDKNSVSKDILLTASDGKKYSVSCCSLPMILAIGFRVKGVRGIQFRQWANRHLQEFMVKVFLMNDERQDYFDEIYPESEIFVLRKNVFIKKYRKNDTLPRHQRNVLN